MKGQLLLAEAARTPWALTPDYLALAASVLVRWSLNAPISAEVRDKIDHDIDARAQRAESRKQSGMTAVIPVYGVLTQRPPEDISGNGGTSSAMVAQAVKQAVNDSNVAQILLEFDTPGGSVYGITEAATAIFNARQQKPVIGIANSMAASAGLWLAAQCSEFYCTDGGEVGSIGVYTAHQYIGKALEKEGVEVNLISAGDYKTEGNPFEPLGDEARAAIQLRVDQYYSAFVNAVARGRGVDAATVGKKYGQGRMLGAEDALAAGLIDGITTFDALLDKLRADAGKLSAQRPNRSRNAALRLQTIR